MCKWTTVAYWSSTVVALAACGGDVTSPVLDMNGVWAWSETYADTANAISCTFVGSIIVAQTGATFGGEWTGTETCSMPGGSQTVPGSGPIVNGTISGADVVFLAPAPNWHYQGTLSGSPPNRMSGTVLATDSATYHFSGTWQATR